MRDGKTSEANVNAVTNATGKILSSVKLEMEYFKLIGKTPEIALMLGAGNGATAEESGAGSKKK